MFTRISSISAAILLVTACGSESDTEAENAINQGLDGSKIRCAVNGESQFSDSCQAERLSTENGVTLIIHHPDGGFRRFKILTDGRGIEAADGAELAKIEIVADEKILVSVGPDQYIMPARMETAVNNEVPASQAGN
ncbi:hypothetical protein AB1K62_03780 [Parasphingorhabdus sp. JC815]|uniref:hypothetical protein n=1 Tax=Parasphingorhabdus sp. JC815 TaxID=3232140 RepID=UPI003458A167